MIRQSFTKDDEQVSFHCNLLLPLKPVNHNVGGGLIPEMFGTHDAIPTSKRFQS